MIGTFVGAIAAASLAGFAVGFIVGITLALMAYFPGGPELSARTPVQRIRERSGSLRSRMKGNRT